MGQNVKLTKIPQMSKDQTTMEHSKNEIDTIRFECTGINFDIRYEGY